MWQTRISQSTQVKSARSMTITSPPLALQVLITRHMHSAHRLTKKSLSEIETGHALCSLGLQQNLGSTSRLMAGFRLHKKIRLKRLLGNKTIQRRHEAFEMATSSKTQFRYTMFQFKMSEQIWGRLVMPQVLYSAHNFQYHNFQRS
jgi:hypothetical protein